MTSRLIGPHNQNTKYNTATGTNVIPVNNYQTTATKVARPIGLTSDLKRLDHLVEMLTYRRPDRSTTEQKFIRKWIMSVGAEPDGLGNFSIRIGDAPVLWSCHTDSVHRYAGFQKLQVSKNLVCALHEDSFMSNCLGADDATGVWIMREMIQAEVPGLYVFHRGEEIGGKGSKWRADNHIEQLKEMKVAVAFDRKGYGDIITSQGGVCASPGFANKFGKLLGSWWMGTYGVYTDTAEYTHLIPECTNLSVGYFNQHTDSEWQDLLFASWLRDKMVTLSAHEIAELAERKPQPKYSYRAEDYDNYRDMLNGYCGYEGDYYNNKHYNKNKYYRGGKVETEEEDEDFFSKKNNSSEDFRRLVESFPRCTVDLMEQWGISAQDLKDHICAVYGTADVWDR